MLTVVPGDGSGHEGGKDGSPSLVDEIVREGARRMLAEALQAEVEAYIAAFAAERLENGRRLVVRNGYHQSREVLTSAGAATTWTHSCAVGRAGGRRWDRRQPVSESVRLDPELKRALLIRAAEEHVSVSEVIRRASASTCGPADQVSGRGRTTQLQGPGPRWPAQCSDMPTGHAASLPHKLRDVRQPPLWSATLGCGDLQRESGWLQGLRQGRLTLTAAVRSRSSGSEASRAALVLA